MSRTKKGSKGPGYEYWSARPGNRNGGTISPHGGKHTKKYTHRVERHTNKKEAREAIDD